MQIEPSKNSSLLKFLRADNKEPLAKIALTILNQNGLKPHFTLIKGDYYYEPNGEITTVYTDSNGELLLNNLPDGDYRFFYQGVEIANLHIDNDLADPGVEGSILVPAELLEKADVMQSLSEKISKQCDWMQDWQSGKLKDNVAELLNKYNAEADDKKKLTIDELEQALAEKQSALENKYEVVKVGDDTYLKPKGASEEAMFKAYRISKTGEKRSPINCLSCFRSLFSIHLFRR